MDRRRQILILLVLVEIVSGSSLRAAVEHEFRLKRPEAESVIVMGEFNGWKGQPLTKGSDGVWRVRVALSPGTHGYKFLVNGSEWLFDPENPKRKQVDGVENSAVEISDTGVASVATTATASANPPLSPRPAASFTTSSMLSPTPGEILITEVSLSAKQRADAAREDYRGLVHARMAIAVPQGFDPQKSWPLLVVSNTEAYSNIDSLRQFKQAALDEGWIVLAADAVEAEKNKEGGCRWPTIAAAFDYLTATWPAMREWPIACGGMSGGAKNSAFLAAELAADHRRVIGMLMMGCNQDMATVAYHKSRPPGFLQTAVFLSSGKSDTIATPEQHEYVKNSLRGGGFHKVRLESFDGAHDIYQPHIGEALRWFIAQSGKTAGSTGTASPSPGSSFDQFFKKKP